MTNIKTLFIYYTLLLLGLIITSWLIWSRFIRERMIRDVPDGLFTEYRFWILCYICIIYLYVIKNYIKPKEPNDFLYWLSDMLIIPQKTLDHFIKYNSRFENNYYAIMNNVLSFSQRFPQQQYLIIFYMLQIVPRIILVSFLLIDTFYFHTIELFYKVVLIGIIPFIFRYICYSIKDICDHWMTLLENKY